MFISSVLKNLKALTMAKIPKRNLDGGPDEALKKQQNLTSWIKMFLKYNLDALFVFTHVPGSSAYNPVERRMAPLSKHTAGLILPFNTYGTHLNPSN